MSYFGEEFKEYDRLPISIIDEAKVRLIKKGVNEGDYKNEDNKIVIKDVLEGYSAGCTFFYSFHAY